MAYPQDEIRGLESSPIPSSRVLFGPLFGRAHFWADFGCHRTVITPLSQCLVGVIRAAARPVPWSETQCWRGFPYCEPKTACYVFLPFEFEGHHKRVDWKLIEKWVRESCVQLRAALTL